MAKFGAVGVICIMNLVLIFVFNVLISMYTYKFYQRRTNPIMAHRKPASVICLSVNIVLGMNSQILFLMIRLIRKIHAVPNNHNIHK